MIDLRSDTFTRPSPGMLDAMFKARVGDDVFGEDESVNLLEKMTADYFGMEAGLFCPSGTMANQIAIKCHTQPGEEIICHKQSHVYIYEGGGIAFHSGCQVRALDGAWGKITAPSIAENINPTDIHKPPTTLVSVENTANRGGGSCYTEDEIKHISKLCREKELKLHLDGARLWNALIATGQDARFYGASFDSISVCYSKGLGAPVGSVLMGSKTSIQKARRYRKLMGGGMRQAGYLAAACIYALEHHVDRLKQDHQHAHSIAEALSKKDFIHEIFPVETNVVIFEVKGRYTADSFSSYMKQHQILCIPISSTHVRMVTHLDVTEAMIDRTISNIEDS